MKNLLMIIFALFFLFGCVQQEVETPIVDNGEQTIPDETEQEMDLEEEIVDTEKIILYIEDSGDFVQQKCVYSEGEMEAVYLIADNLIKASSSNAIYEMVFIIDGKNNVMYDKNGFMLMGMKVGCDWVKYDFNVIQDVLESEGLVSEDEKIMEEIVSLDEEKNLICEDTIIDEKEFIISGNICDGTNDLLEFMLMAYVHNV